MQTLLLSDSGANKATSYLSQCLGTLSHDDIVVWLTMPRGRRDIPWSAWIFDRKCSRGRREERFDLHAPHFMVGRERERNTVHVVGLTHVSFFEGQIDYKHEFDDWKSETNSSSARRLRFLSRKLEA